MAQEYKEWDRKFASEKRTAVATDEEIKESLSSIHDSWIYSSLERSWKMDYIRNGVYSLDGSCDKTAEEWQKFRVGLKAVTTRVKLVRLKRYWDDTTAGLQGIHMDWMEKHDYAWVKAESERRYMRVDNYIGALVRGGQLSLNHKVRR